MTEVKDKNDHSLGLSRLSRNNDEESAADHFVLKQGVCRTAALRKSAVIKDKQVLKPVLHHGLLRGFYYGSKQCRK